MKLDDLGHLNDPVLLFGGPYSNLQVIRALILDTQARGGAPNHMICTGDLVAYCGQPVETVKEVKQLNCPVVAGNCEVQLVQGRDDWVVGLKPVRPVTCSQWDGLAMRINL